MCIIVPGSLVQRYDAVGHNRKKDNGVARISPHAHNTEGTPIGLRELHLRGGQSAGKTRKSIQLTGKVRLTSLYEVGSAPGSTLKTPVYTKPNISSESPIQQNLIAHQEALGRIVTTSVGQLNRLLPLRNINFCSEGCLKEFEDGHPQPLHHQSQKKFIPGRIKVATQYNIKVADVKERRNQQHKLLL
ncbi:hypothetical protein NQ317_007633 [Molorchus minor]|uniref:C2H2-type domain-containing protein n=1 Tax=Molorchus minor TaxID=1323400 RepID=A0ABQ9IUF9_9CUCU|nr:hypothetical protein NQ317_007633 [Molorchus minor]